MTVSKKRRTLPEEDLAAAVADIINSPITRSNLNFLRVSPGVAAVEPAPKPRGVELPPMGDAPTPPGLGRLNQGRALWQAEELGSIFEQKRVRRIMEAREALSAVEEKVYELLWSGGSQGGEGFRLTHCSLQRMASEAGIHIKTVRELIPRLIRKGFVRIEREADVRRNVATQYRVLSAASVAVDQQRRNRLYVAKSGKGVFYVHPVLEAQQNPWVID